ncbi:MAG: hypothetical protein HOQ05_10980 [Corynebacteriales bacterium]|nr:hypothetical protein [Mycobacteriales bacterium]
MDEHIEEERPTGEEAEPTAEELPLDEAEPPAAVSDLQPGGPRFVIGRGSHYGGHETNGTPRRGIQF